MSYNTKSLFKEEEHGNPFEFIETSIDWLLNETKKQGFDVQASAFLTVEGTTRFGRSQVTQHTDLNTISLNLKLAQGKRVANVSSSMTNPSGLQNLVDETVKSVKSTPEIEFFQGLPASRGGAPVDLSGKEWSIEDRADCIIESVNAAEEINNQAILAGTASETRLYTRIKSTEGIDIEDSSQRNYFKVNSITGEPEQRGYGQEELYWRHHEPDYAILAKEATQTAVDTENVITLDAKEYEVLLDTQAVADLVVYVLMSADSISFHESNSYTADRLGDQIFDKSFSIQNAPRNSQDVTNVASFDREGLATTNQHFIDQGVLKFVTYNSFMASKYLEDKNLATGTSLFMPFGASFVPMSGLIDNGDKTTEQQISDMDDGLYVKNFWYNRFTLRREGGLTGLTRNGLYRVKNGEIQGAVRNLRYTESFVKAFGPDNIISLSKDRRMYYLSTCPSIHLKKFNFSSVAHSKD
ncbi:MAG: metallopeptidase TldD-related protein [Candidatus Kariarchaeaceae archaeon]|jgi:predicted Zn-dependent protease